MDRFDGELLFYHSSFETEAAQIAAAVPAIRESVCLDGGSDRSPSLKEWLEGYEQPFEMGPENPEDLTERGRQQRGADRAGEG